MPLLAHEKTLTCPYNPSHQITEARMWTHLTKCRKNHPNSGHVVCPFDQNHHIPKPEEQYHKATCPGRKSVELMKYSQSMGSKPSQGSTLPKVRENYPMIPQTEDWEEETCQGTYNPEKAAAEKNVLRKIEGATPSERKKFRAKEKERCERLAMGLTVDDPDNNRGIPGLGREESRGSGAGIHRDSHTVPLRKPTLVAEAATPVTSLNNELLQIHLGRGAKIPGQKNSLRTDGLRRPGSGSMDFAAALTGSNSSKALDSTQSEDGSTATNYSDLNTSNLLTMARGRAQQFMAAGGRTPGGLQAGRTPGGLQAGRTPGGLQAGRTPEGLLAGRTPEGLLAGRTPGGLQARVKVGGGVNGKVSQDTGN